MKTTLAERWALAHDTVARLTAWQPEFDEVLPCVLLGTEALAYGREAEPAVLWKWTQADQRFQALMTVLNLLEMADYPEMLSRRGLGHRRRQRRRDSRQLPSSLRRQRRGHHQAGDGLHRSADPR